MDELFNEENKREESHTLSEIQTPNWCKKVYTSRTKTKELEYVALIRIKEYSNVSRIADRDHLTDENWHVWKEHMKRVFTNCDINGYIIGAIKHPDQTTDPDSARNWDKNDYWAQQVIIHNITELQINHVGSKNTTKVMYSALLVTHENMAHQTINYIQNQLYETKAHDGNNLLKYFDTLKSYRDRINKFPNKDFHVLDTRFKSIISASLPSSWFTFVESYNGNANDLNDPDTKRRMSTDAFIGLLCEECKIRINRSDNRKANGTNGSINLVPTQKAYGTKKSLEDRISNTKASITSYCEHSKRPGHWLSKCRKFKGNKCNNCGKIGHQAKECWAKKRNKDKEK